MMKKFIIILSTLLFNPMVYAQTSSTTFDMTPYLEKCGGKVYAGCDSAELNQETIYNAALKLAVQTNRKLVLGAGADWCGPCLQLDKTMKSNLEEKKRFDKNFVLVKLKGDAKSFPVVATKLSIKANAFPTFFVIETSKEKVLGSFIPTGYESKELFDKVEDVAAQRKTQFLLFPARDVSATWLNTKIRVELLKKSPELSFDKIKLVAQDKVCSNNQADLYYKQGMFELFTFNYVDAVRALKVAVDNDPSCIQAYIALSDSLIQIGASNSYGGNLLKVSQLLKAGNVAPVTRLIAEYKILQACRYDEDFAEQAGITETGRVLEDKIVEKMVKIRDVVLQQKNSDALVLFGGKFEYLAALNIQANHIGAHHYLVHHYENAGEYKDALKHGEILAGLAPKSAHAQHMYGHILPKLGRWNEAIAQFEKADKIHEEWFRQTGATAIEEWHYPHNLDLLGHAYNWTNQFQKAEKSWGKACQLFGNKYCKTYGLFLLSQSQFARAEEVFSKLSKTDNSAQSLTLLAQFMGNFKDQTLSSAMARENNLPVIQKIMFANSSQENGMITREVETSVNQSGFDSWSHNVLMADVYSTLAKKLGKDSLAADIKLSKLAVGFVCRQK